MLYTLHDLASQNGISYIPGPSVTFVLNTVDRALRNPSILDLYIPSFTHHLDKPAGDHAELHREIQNEFEKAYFDLADLDTTDESTEYGQTRKSEICGMIFITLNRQLVIATDEYYTVSNNQHSLILTTALFTTILHELAHHLSLSKHFETTLPTIHGHNFYTIDERGSTPVLYGESGSYLETRLWGGVFSIVLSDLEM
ncbi:hypothetical protein HGRIS_011407 [Hohenbuehelia grisea]|uniref:Uncharacterized protein n=1 Tax=Hohenbuehelia grisea TaxID=104357 RepID=A0ABR3JV11_9AGAR